MEALVYSANVLYLLSYLVRDMLHLRLLTIVAACCLVTYFYTLAEPLMTVVYWNLFFVALNALQLGFILRSRIRAKRRLPGANTLDLEREPSQENDSDGIGAELSELGIMS